MNRMVFEWRTNPDIVARFVKAQDIATWKKHDIVLKPNEIMGVLQEGKVVNTYTEQKVKSAVGGIGRKLFKSAAKMDERFLFAMATPFQVPIPFKVQSSDQLEITGVTTIEYQLQLDDVMKLLNLFASRNIPQPTDSGPGVLLTRTSIGEMMYGEFFAKVYQEELGRIELSQLRADANLPTTLAASLDSEMRRTTNEIGLTYRSSHTVFNPNAYDEVQKYRGLFNLEKARGDIDQDAKLLVLEREYELLARDIELEAQCNLAAVTGEGAIELEQARNEIRIQREQAEAEFDIRVREQQQALSMEREQWELEQAAADKELERKISAGDTVAQEREFKLEQQDRLQDERKDQLDSSLEMKDKQMTQAQDQTTELMKMAMENMKGADPQAVAAMMQTMMQQQTAQQNANMEQETQQKKELMKQQTAQQFIDRAMGDSQGDVTLVQGDHVAGTSVDSSTGTMISGNVNIGQLGGSQTPPPPAAGVPMPPCPRCGNASRFIAQYNRHYCDNCSNYV